MGIDRQMHEQGRRQPDRLFIQIQIYRIRIFLLQQTAQIRNTKRIIYIEQPAVMLYQKASPCIRFAKLSLLLNFDAILLKQPVCFNKMLFVRKEPINIPTNTV